MKDAKNIITCCRKIFSITQTAKAFSESFRTFLINGGIGIGGSSGFPVSCITFDGCTVCANAECSP
jgi:hypothetical protein